MTTKHTPGPWATEGNGRYYASVRAPSRMVADMRIIGGAVDAENTANARLIAAAPDLLEALETMVDLQGKAASGFPLSENELREWAVANYTARAAIAKARGAANA